MAEFHAANISQAQRVPSSGVLNTPPMLAPIAAGLQQPIVCVACQYSVSTMPEFMQHVYSHLPFYMVPQLSCFTCKYNFGNEDRLATHNQQVHHIRLEDDRAFEHVIAYRTNEEYCTSWMLGYLWQLMALFTGEAIASNTIQQFLHKVVTVFAQNSVSSYYRDATPTGLELHFLSCVAEVFGEDLGRAQLLPEVSNPVWLLWWPNVLMLMSMIPSDKLDFQERFGDSKGLNPKGVKLPAMPLFDGHCHLDRLKRNTGHSSTEAVRLCRKCEHRSCVDLIGVVANFSHPTEGVHGRNLWKGLSNIFK